MIDRHFDISCDSCSTYCDTDPLDISVIGKTPTIPSTVHSPAKIKELTYFWLCQDCKPDLPNGATDFFIESYFTEDEYQLCTYCKAYIPDEVLEEYDDTEVCLTCSPAENRVEQNF
jgi:hypothetical protein